MFFLFAYQLDDEEISSLLETIKSGRSGQPKFEQAFSRLISDEDISNVLMSLIHRSIQKINPRRKREYWEDALNEAYTVMYKLIQKINSKQTKKSFISEMKKVMIHKLMNFLIAELEGEGVSIGRETKERVYKVKKFMIQFKSDKGRYPSIAEIAKGTKFTEQQISDFIQASNLMRGVSLQTMLDDSARNQNRTIDDYLKDERYSPEKLFEDRSLNRKFESAIFDFLNTLNTKDDVKENAKLYLFELLKDPKQTQRSIQKKLNLTQRKGQLIWDKFRAFLNLPKYRRIFLEAHTPSFIQKLAKAHAQYLTTTDENFIKNLVSRVMNERRCL